MKRLHMVVAAFAALAGCSGFDAGKSAAREAEAPLRIAVFTGRGARGIGACRWVEIASTAENAVATPVDGAAIRAGALDSADLLIMPGGNSRTISKDLGREGHRRIKEFLLAGGGYVGTCAGCCLLMQSDKSHHNMMDVIPYTFSVCGGKADINIAFDDNAAKLAGIKKGNAKMRYSEGPVPRESKTKDTNATAVVVARYAGNVNTVGSKPRESFAGHPAAFACTYGKGRMFVFTVHPEVDVDDHYAIKGAFRYVVGRDIKWKYPQRKPGQLAVGFMCDQSFGVETARFFQKLVREREFDVLPIADMPVAEGDLRHIDAVLDPDDVDNISPDIGLYGRNVAKTKEFIGRGGRVIAWGRAAESAKKHVPDVVCVSGSGEAVEALRSFASEPAKKRAAIPAKPESAIKVAFYADKGGAQYNVAEMLKLSPGYEPVPMSARDIAGGSLDGMDVLLMPGGGSATEYKRLGPKGAEAITRFVRGGGKYYGICAGAFLARQDKGALGIVPFRDDKPAHYRGWAPTRIRLTPEGKKVFGGSADVRPVMYWGGPAFVEGSPVEDADVKVLAKYEGRLVNTSNPKKVEPMYGKGAIVGGRVGKGKVYAQGPHPEMYDYSMDMVYSGFKFLTGVAPEPVNADRERGAKSVLVSLTWDETAKEQMDFYINRLVPDSRLDIRRCRDMNNNALAHVETVVLLQPAKCNWVKPYDCVHTVLKPADWTDRIKDFIAAGGEVIILADTEDERKSASALEGAKVVGSYDEVMSALTGQAAARVEETRKTSGEKPLRMAVYVDKGARNIGAFRWLQIATEAENVEGFPVDGAAVRAGALDKADVIVMPGGSGSREGASLGEEGREKVKAFVRGGGSYIGTCAGCYLAMAQGEGPSKNYLGLLPYRDGASGGRADIDVMFNEKAEKLAGINSGVAKIRYAGGPVPKHTGEEVEGTRVDVVATYAGDVKTPVKPNASKIGKPAALAGTCGKGRLFVFTVHPESDFDDHWIIKRALRYLAGRDVDWKRPCKSPGRTAVGLMCDGSMGVETALFAQRLLREKEFDIVPLNALTVKEGGLEEVSAVFAPANLDSVDSDAGLYGKNADRTKKFLSGGGRVFAWGNAAERARKHGMDGVTFVSGGEAALAEARRLSK